MNALLFSNALLIVSQNSIYLYLQLVAVFSLVFLLVERELTYNLQHSFARVLQRITLIGIVPLLFAFVLILNWHINHAK
jgi:hypothetical protein